MKRFQTGVTLIVVLLILIVITVIGSLAVRSSILSLKVATVSQAQQLLMQNSDAALFNVEDPTQLARSMALNGMFGYLKGDASSGKELVFCYKANNNLFFNFHNASLVSWNGTSIVNNGLGPNGFCKVESGFFTSGRNTVMTQIAVKASDISELADFQHMQKGTDADSIKKAPAQMYTVYAISIFPGLANSSVTDLNDKIKNCFSQYMNGLPQSKADELEREILLTKGSTALTEQQKAEKLAVLNNAKITVPDCLNALGVPTHTQVARYALTDYVTK
ncbi:MULTISPECIES: pilus assembly protein PilX [unclassified Acinetobacter]|uniref:pilus assembly protein PilX n=1 Tax=unclassified Acinetobacter TaxID=196816 RepID=UPI0015D42260|nr:MULTISPECIES: pilus assembly protein PilX [unclassified Acinetobacter]